MKQDSSHVRAAQRQISKALQERDSEAKRLRAALRALDGKGTPGRRPRKT